MGVVGAANAPSLASPQGVLTQLFGTERSIVLAIAAFVLCGVLVFRHVQPQYLTSATALRPTIGSYVIILVIHFAVWSGALWVTGLVKPAFLSGIVLDQKLTARVVGLGLAALIPVLSVTAFWKSEDPGLTNLRLYRANALEGLEKLRDQKINEDSYNLLKTALANLDSEQATVRTRLRSARDRELLGQWSRCASPLLLDHTPYVAINNLDQAKVVAAHICLKRTEPE
jgi:hypothetical protein